MSLILLSTLLMLSALFCALTQKKEETQDERR